VEGMLVGERLSTFLNYGSCRHEWMRYETGRFFELGAAM